jgi:hypothetical protein
MSDHPGRNWEAIADFIGRPQRTLTLTEHIFLQRQREDYREHLNKIAASEGHLIDG